MSDARLSQATYDARRPRGPRYQWRRAAQTSRRSRSAPEGDARRLAVLLALELEVLALGEVEHGRDDVGGNGVDRRVEVAHDRVVVAARVLDGVLDLSERGLELREVLVRLEVRVRLGEREELAQGGGQRVLRLGTRIGRLRGHGGAPRAHDRVERAALVGGVALDRLDQVRDQVRAALELHVDVRPRLLGSLAEPDELVVPRAGGDDQPRDDEEKNPAADAHRATLPRAILASGRRKHGSLGGSGRDLVEQPDQPRLDGRARLPEVLADGRHLPLLDPRARGGQLAEVTAEGDDAPGALDVRARDPLRVAAAKVHALGAELREDPRCDLGVGLGAGGGSP